MKRCKHIWHIVDGRFKRGGGGLVETKEICVKCNKKQICKVE